MQHLNEVLETSIAQYQGIFEILRTLGRQLAMGQTGALDDGLQRLEFLQREASSADEGVLECLRLAGPAVEKNPLHWHRLQLLQEVVEQIRMLRAKAEARMALDSEELSRLKGGQAAISGYRPATDLRGGLLSSAG